MKTATRFGARVEGMRALDAWIVVRGTIIIQRKYPDRKGKGERVNRGKWEYVVVYIHSIR